jgi:hypothetical protein
MKEGKYQPYRNSNALKQREAQRKADWFKYDPYTQEKTDAKALNTYVPDIHPVILKEPIRMVQNEDTDHFETRPRPLIISFLLHIFQPLFEKVSFGITSAAQTILNKFKRHK